MGTVMDKGIPLSHPMIFRKEMKKCSRGSLDTVVDNIHKCVRVLWQGNATVTVVSNILPVYPMANVFRWSAREKQKITVRQPQTLIWEEYNGWTKISIAIAFQLEGRNGEGQYCLGWLIQPCKLLAVSPS